MTTGKSLHDELKIDGPPMRPPNAEEYAFAQYLGAMPAFSNQEDINAWILELRGRDELETAQGTKPAFIP